MCPSFKWDFIVHRKMMGSYFEKIDREKTKPLFRQWTRKRRRYIVTSSLLVVCYRNIGPQPAYGYRNSAGMLPKLRRYFTRLSFASWSTDRSTKLGLKQNTTGLLVHQISRRCDLWCGRNRRLKFFCFHPRSRAGSRNYTLTETVSDQCQIRLN